MTLLLIDSASLWYRVFYGMPDSLVSPTGEPVNAIRGFLDVTARLINSYSPNRIALCLDGDWRPSWRVKLFPEYKNNRLEDDESEEEPDTLTPQIPVIIDLFDALGFPILGVDDYEADDVIATLALNQPGPVRVVTGDRDLFQVVSDKKDVKVIYLAKGISSHDLVDESWIANKYQIPGDRYGLFAMIRGDPSDGLPGIRGIGEKGAAQLANQFQSMDSIIADVSSESPRTPEKLSRKILDDLNYAKKATKLVSCVADVRLPEVNLEIPSGPSDSQKLALLEAEFGLKTSVQRLVSALKWQ
ncbi:MAG: 5'-3' exonuclease [Actinobacteria bacterium]|nr:5'-3' exonuclease [Actinomycetota bacterium]